MPKRVIQIRIAIVSDFYLDFVGGAQSSIVEQRAALTAAGHTVFLVANARLGRRGTDGTGGLEPRDLPVRPAFTVPGLILPIVRANRTLAAQLSAFFIKNRVEVVHVQSEFGLAQAATDTAKSLGLGVVQTVHTFYWASDGIFPTIVAPIMRAGLQRATGRSLPRKHYVRRPSDNLLRNLTVAMANQVDGVISPSAHQAADLASAGVATPIHVIPNPIARSPRPPAVLTAEQAASPRILWAARCEPVKRPLPFAEAAIMALGRTNTPFRVDFVGDGSELARLRKAVAGHPQIRVHGSLSHDDVIDLMDESAVVALTSYNFDNQPMTIAEAVNRYRGVLYCDPKLQEGLHNGGFLSTTPDADGLANALVELVESPAKLIELSQGARVDSATFAAATYVERAVAAYEEAAKRHN
jgi:glycosyltransferase involved in cell wall biosynthesis